MSTPNKITLKTMVDATPQQVFDQMATHLLTQAKKSMKGEECYYRGADINGEPNGLMCAAGCFIADDEYKRTYETAMVSAVFYSYGIDKKIDPKVFDIILAGQRLHDGIDPVDWRTGLRHMATARCLNHVALNNFPEYEAQFS